MAIETGDSEGFWDLSDISRGFLNVGAMARMDAAQLEALYEELVVHHAAISPQLAAEARKPVSLDTWANTGDPQSDDVTAATICSDAGRMPETLDAWIEAAHHADQAAPVFGVRQVLGRSFCASWSAFGDRYTGGWDHGRAPILLLNQQWDLATPLAWAQTMTLELRRAHLVTISGWGHGIATPCSTRAVDGYLLTGRLPTTSFCTDGLGLFTVRLRLEMGASRRSLTAGQSTTLQLTIENPHRNGTAVHHLRTCLALPAGLVRKSSAPHAALTHGRYCWSAATLPDGADTTYALTARALRGASGNLIATATTTAAGAIVAPAKLRLSITPLAPPSFTG